MAFSGFQDFRPEFGSALQQFIAASPGISVGSGYRDVTRQGQLWNAALKKYGSVQAARKWVAPPGRSYHNKRLAADLQYASPEARQWAHANAAKYGLAFPLGNEAWHIELANARNGGGGGGGDTGAGTYVDVAGADPLLGDTLAEAVMDKKSYGLSGLVENAQNRLAGGDTEGQPQIRETRGDMTPAPLQIESAAVAPEEFLQRKQPLNQNVAPLADLFDLKAIGQAGVPVGTGPVPVGTVPPRNRNRIV